MRSISLLSCLTILSFAFACAAAPPSTVDAIGPATQSGTSILILPFSSPPGNELYRWVGPAIQHVIAADVSHGSRVLDVLAPASAPAADDADAALSAARNAGASFVVFGQTQLVEREVRLTGEVMDVAASRSIGGLKATGKLDDLFHLEDAIGSQVLAALPASLREDQTAQAPTTSQPPSTDQPQPYTAGPTIYDNGGNYSSTYAYPSGGYTYSYPSYDYYPDYYPSYSYPYYPYYSYPYAFYGAFFFDGHDHHDHHDGHHDDHHDYHYGHGDYHDGHNDAHGWNGSNRSWSGSNRSWSGSSSGRAFTGPTRSSPNFNRSTFGMNSSPSMRSGGFQSAPRSSGGMSRGFTGAGPTRSFGGGMSRGFSGGGMSRGGGGMAHAGSGAGHGGGHR
jgi:TolB-like protein